MRLLSFICGPFMVLCLHANAYEMEHDLSFDKTIGFISDSIIIDSVIPYRPFVDPDRYWNTYEESEDARKRTPFYLFRSSVEQENGEVYYPFYRHYNRTDEGIIGFLREEERRVYMYDTISRTETLVYDFSLGEGDVFSYSYGLDSPAKCKVLNQRPYTDGPKLYKFIYDEMTDEVTEYSRYLHSWTIGIETALDVYEEATTWIEAAGGIHGPLADASPNPKSRSRVSYTAYLDNLRFEYLPFQFYDSSTIFQGLNFGINYVNDGSQVRYDTDLTFELHGDTLRITGFLVVSCSALYALVHEEPTNSPDTTCIVLQLYEAGLAYDCEALYETDMSIPGFDPDKNYVVRDHLGSEHEVVNTNHLADGIVATSAVPYRGPARIYNLQGQRMARPQQGLNIIGDRKVLVR